MPIALPIGQMPIAQLPIGQMVGGIHQMSSINHHHDLASQPDVDLAQ